MTAQGWSTMTKLMIQTWNPTCERTPCESMYFVKLYILQMYTAKLLIYCNITQHNNTLFSFYNFAQHNIFIFHIFSYLLSFTYPIYINYSTVYTIILNTGQGRRGNKTSELDDWRSKKAEKVACSWNENRI